MPTNIKFFLIYPVFIVIFASAALLVTVPLPAFAQDNGGQLSPVAQAISQGINQQRANAGLPPLNVHPLLNQAAQNHADDMVNHHIYGHTGSDGSYVRQRVERLGYASGGWVSENWVSANDADGAMNWWMSDWIHRQNILNPTWRDIGIGVSTDASGGLVFVTDFTAGSDGNPPVELAAAPTQETLTIPPNGIDYTIQAGDTLLAIAYRYGIDWTMIAEANKLNEDTLLQIGEVLRLPGVESVGGPVADEPVKASSEQTDDKSSKAKEATNSPSSQAPTTESTPTENQTANGFTPLYTVQPGNTLVDIAQIYNITWQELADANGLGEDSVLEIGQELRVPRTVQAAPLENQNRATAAADSPEEYTVQAGDTIISIAVKFGLDWDTLLQLNGLTESTLLELDQKIRLK